MGARRISEGDEVWKEQEASPPRILHTSPRSHALSGLPSLSDASSLQASGAERLRMEEVEAMKASSSF